MNKYTTVDNILEAFSRILVAPYRIRYIEERSYFIVSHIHAVILSFEYDSTSMTFCHFKEKKVTGHENFFRYFSSFFKRFDSLSHSQSLVDCFFKHEISKLLFIEPITIDNHVVFNTQISVSGQRITLSKNFSYSNAYNMFWFQLVYVLNEELKIKPIIHLRPIMKDFDTAHFFIDEDTGALFYHYGDFSDNDLKLNTSDNYQHCIDMFINQIAPKVYQFYLLKNNMENIYSNTVTLDDFKTLEMILL